MPTSLRTTPYALFLRIYTSLQSRWMAAQEIGQVHHHGLYSVQLEEPALTECIGLEIEVLHFLSNL